LEVPVSLLRGAVNGDALVGGDGDIDDGVGRRGGRQEQGGDDADENNVGHVRRSFGGDILIVLRHADPSVQTGDGRAILPAVLLDLWHRVAIIMPWFHASLTTTDLPKSGL
jgi:hypothetical protein